MKKVTALILAVVSTFFLLCGSARAAGAFDPMAGANTIQPVDHDGPEGGGGIPCMNGEDLVQR